jgi:hypothetical protein
VTATRRPDRDDARIVKRDLRYLWIDVRFAHSAMKHRPADETVAASGAPHEVVDRIESELAGEANRYRWALYACIAVALMPAILSGVAWSALYWLPVTIFWFPFDRGYYGLPWLSLYEWTAYLFLALFFAFGFALVAESHGATRRLSADYHRLADADDPARADLAAEVRRGGLARTELMMRSSGVFTPYVALLDAVPATAAPAAAQTTAPAGPEPTL